MKYFALSLSLAIVGTMSAGANAADVSASAPHAACVRADFAYNARPIGRHLVKVWNSVGADRSPLTLTTDCINLDPVSAVGIQMTGPCVAQGDTVSAVAVDGHHENCRVHSIAPFMPDDIEHGYK
jgi:hypothetical protein